MFYYVFYFLRGDLKMDKTIVKKFKEGDKNAALAVLHKYEPLINNANELKKFVETLRIIK